MREDFNMTYGEYYYRVKRDMKLVDGTWVSKPLNMKIPPRMSRKEAAKYYNQKFKEYWNTQGKEKRKARNR